MTTGADASDPVVPVSGRTLAVGVIGDPVRHSRSPALHNAAFRALGIDAVSLAYPVAVGSGAAAVAAMRTLGLRGLSVTMPHKEAVAAAADRRTPQVEALGAANCLVNDDGVITAHTTDGEGLVRSLQAGSHRPVAGETVVVVGAGGAARAVIGALVDAGASVVVVNRSGDRATRAVADVASPGPGSARVGEAADIADAAVVVNATPVGMVGYPGVPFDVSLLGKGHTVVDLIYHPERTALLEAATAVGADAVNGLPMLLHQAAIQLELWTGRPPPLDAMLAGIDGGS